MRRLMDTVETRYDHNDQPFYRRVLGKVEVDVPPQTRDEMNAVLPPLQPGWRRNLLNVSIVPMWQLDQPLNPQVDYEVCDERVDVNVPGGDVPVVVAG